MAQLVSKISGKFAELFYKIISSSEVDLEKIKGDIWADLAAIYYKYDDNAQKMAFREVTREIAYKLSEGKWALVYKKLYHEENLAKDIRYRALVRRM